MKCKKCLHEFFPNPEKIVSPTDGTVFYLIDKTCPICSGLNLDGKEKINKENVENKKILLKD